MSRHEADDRGQSGKYVQVSKMLLIQELLPETVPDQLPAEKHLPHPQHCKLFHAPVKPDVSHTLEQHFTVHIAMNG